jgi:FHS family glucose/mannose:H+ symporter-like MFS transporter
MRELNATRAEDRVHLSARALVGIASAFLLMGVLASAYGPLLEHLTVRFGITLAVAGTVLSTHFAGGFVGVIASMVVLERVRARAFMIGALGILAVGCAVVALAAAWPWFLAGVFLIGISYGALDIGLNQLVAHSESRHRVAALNALNAAFGIGAVAGPLLVAAAGTNRISLIYAAGVAVAILTVPLARGLHGQLPVERALRVRGLDVLVVVFAAAFVTYVAVEAGVGGWMTSHLESIGFASTAAATYTSGFWLALAAGRLLVALVPSSVGEARIVLVSALAGTLALAWTAFVPVATPVAYMLTGLAIAPIFPTGIVWLAKLRPGDARATSWLFPTSMIGGAAGPGAIGLVVAQSGVGRTPLVLSLGAVLMVAAFAAAARIGSAARA